MASSKERHAYHRIVKRSFFFRMQLFSVALITFVLFVTSVWSSTKTYRESREMFTESCINTTAERVVSIDLAVSSILDTVSDLQDDAFIRSFLNADSQDLSFATFKMELTSKVRLLQLSNQYIESAYIYSDANGQVASNSYGLAALHAFPDAKSIQAAMAEKHNGRVFLMDTHPVACSINDRSLDYNALSVVAQLPFNNAAKVEGLVMLNIAQDILYNKLYGDQRLAGDASLLIMNEDNEIIMSSDPAFLYHTLEEIGVQADPLLDGSKHQNGRYDGVPCVLIYDDLPTYNWKVVGIFSTEPLNITMKESTRATLLISFGVFVLTLLFSWTYFNRYTRPIDSIINYVRSRGSANEVTTLTPDIAGEIENIYSSHDELHQRIESMRPILSEHFLRDIFNGAQYDPDELHSRFVGYFGSDFDYNRLLIAILLIEQYDVSLKEKKLDSDLVDTAIMDKIDTTAPEFGLKCLCLHTDISETVLIIQTGQNKRSDVNAFLTKIKQYIKAEWALDTASSIYDRYVPLSELRSGYKHAKLALRYRSFYNGDTIYYCDIENEEQLNFYYPYEKADEMKSCIRLCDKEGAHAALNAILDIVIETSGLNQSVYLALFQLYGTLMSVSDELNIPLNSVFRNKYVVQTIFDLYSREDIVFFFSACIDKLIDIVSQLRTGKNSEYFQQIVDFLKANYTESDISLDTVSEHVHLSPSYLNRILKSACSKTFNQLLGDMRIQEACRLILEDDLQIQQIAEAVGFGSSKYFISVFKKTMGTTPGQYKELHSGKDRPE